MKRYAIYDPSNGDIIQWGAAPNGLPNWDGYGEYLEHEVPGPLVGYCVVDGAVVPKALRTAEITDVPGGVHVGNLPEGTFCSIEVDGERTFATVNDGTLELDFDVPFDVLVRVRFEHARYRIEPIEVTL
jgi:hypothetical protein